MIDYGPTIIDDVERALCFIDNAIDRDAWVMIAMAIKSEFGDSGFDLWDHWSQGHAKYDQAHNRMVWRGISASGKTGIGHLFKTAIANGYKPEKKEFTPEEKARFAKEREARQKAAALKAEQEQARKAFAQDVVRSTAQTVWHKVAKPLGESEYLKNKEIKAFGVRFLHQSLLIVTEPEPYSQTISTANFTYETFIKTLARREQQQKDGVPDDLLVSAHLHKAGTLLVPLYAGGRLMNLQFINHKGNKKFIKGGKKQGCYFFFGGANDFARVCVGEGYATMASVHMAMSWPCFVAFDAGNLLTVARQVRMNYPDSEIIVCGDDDPDNKTNTGRLKAIKAANDIGGVVVLPGRQSDNGL